ncbi:hypothetical protein Cfor_11091 [Coptotermes formosanus]|uniref:CUB domain-containing protein n=1 Tax=Coptotermes formosanus TaxID=36987 RepID=A0A6L2QCQ5_COPFO|nr:hypothetical protein Cfor_11091 [Coptotermes formosanus]
MAVLGLLLALLAVSRVGSYVEAFFTGSSNCTSAAGGAVTKPPTTTPSFFMVDENETSTHLTRDVRETVTAEMKQIRQPVKHRCSGVNHCSFRLTSDYAAADDWGPGVVFIKYACINRQHITKNCQQDISVVGEGFVETPGYPQFNVERNCTWKLRVQEGQRVQVSVLDISLRGIISTETECTDRLTVKEGDRQLLALCGEQEDSIVVESVGAGLDVFFSIRSKNIFPKRGVLFQYKEFVKRGIMSYASFVKTAMPRRLGLSSVTDTVAYKAKPQSPFCGVTWLYGKQFTYNFGVGCICERS